VKKISATILNFASPITDKLDADASIELRRDTLSIAIVLWNSLVLHACDQGEYPADLVARFRKMPPQGSAVMAALVQAMVLRRQALYADDLRLVGEWELRDLGDGEVSLRAVAHAAPEKK